MSKEALDNALDSLNQSVTQLTDKGLYLPAMTMVYSTVDLLSWLTRRSEEKDCDRNDYIAWVNEYLLPTGKLNCSSIDFYSGRCALLHSYSGESRLSKSAKAKHIWYKTDPTRTIIIPKGQPHTLLDVHDVIVGLEEAIASFHKALSQDPELSTRVYARAGSLLNGFRIPKITK